MANIEISTDGNLAVVEDDLTRFSKLYAYTESYMKIQAGTTFAYERDFTFKRTDVRGGTDEASRTTLTIGTDDYGVSINSDSTSSWTKGNGNFSTSGYATLIIKNSIINTRGSGPSLGTYPPKASQENVKMELINSEFYNRTSTWHGLDGSEPMLCPNALLINVKFRGASKLWINGPLHPDSVGIDMVSGGNPSKHMGLANAGAGNVVLQQQSTDYFGCQQVPSSITAYNCKLTIGFRCNSTGANRYLELGKIFKPSLLFIEGDYQFQIEDKDGNVLSNTTQTVGSETEVRAVYVKISNTSNNAGTILNSDILAGAGTEISGMTSAVALPLKMKIRRPDIAPQDFLFTAEDTQLSSDESLKVKTIGGPATMDLNYKNTSPTIEIVQNLDEIYDLLKQYYTANMSSDGGLFVANGLKRTIHPDYTLVRDETILGSPVQVDGFNIKVKTTLDPTTIGYVDITDIADTISGSVHSNFDGYIGAKYLKSTGLVDVSLALTVAEGVQNVVWGVWDRSDGEHNRATIRTAQGNRAIACTSGEELYYVVDSLFARRSPIGILTVSELGDVIPISISRINNPNGSQLIPATLTTAEISIADTLIYSSAEQLVQVKLPDNYTTNERYDASSKTWSYHSTDFPAISYKLEEIQSRETSLIDPEFIDVSPFTFLLSEDSHYTIRQHPSNASGVIINFNSFIMMRQGDDAKVGSFIDHSNGVIMVNGGVPVIANLSVTPSVLETVVDKLPEKILDTPYNGLRVDGTEYLENSLGHHLWVFNDLQIARTMSSVDYTQGMLPATRFTPLPAPIPEGSLGDLIRKSSTTVETTGLFNLITTQEGFNGSPSPTQTPDTTPDSGGGGGSPPPR